LVALLGVLTKRCGQKLVQVARVDLNLVFAIVQQPVVNGEFKSARTVTQHSFQFGEVPLFDELELIYAVDVILCEANFLELQVKIQAIII